LCFYHLIYNQKKRDERKKLSLREGGRYEEEAIVQALAATALLAGLFLPMY
jgi:hypothetical protein